jgi:hypothetical protein
MPWGIPDIQFTIEFGKRIVKDYRFILRYLDRCSGPPPCVIQWKWVTWNFGLCKDWSDLSIGNLIWEKEHWALGFYPLSNHKNVNISDMIGHSYNPHG